MQQMASLVSRTLAIIIDIAIFLAISILIGFIFSLEYDSVNMAFLFLIFVSDVYQGQSVGKRLLKIQVVNFKTGKPAGAIRSIIRNILFPLNILLIPLAVNYILYVSYFRMMGDFVSGTCVVNMKKSVADSP